MPFKDIATSDSVYLEELPAPEDKNARTALRRMQEVRCRPTPEPQKAETKRGANFYFMCTGARRKTKTLRPSPPPPSLPSELKLNTVIFHEARVDTIHGARRDVPAPHVVNRLFLFSCCFCWKGWCWHLGSGGDPGSQPCSQCCGRGVAGGHHQIGRTSYPAVGSHQACGVYQGGLV